MSDGSLQIKVGIYQFIPNEKDNSKLPHSSVAAKEKLLHIQILQKPDFCSPRHPNPLQEGHPEKIKKSSSWGCRVIFRKLVQKTTSLHQLIFWKPFFFGEKINKRHNTFGFGNPGLLCRLLDGLQGLFLLLAHHLRTRFGGIHWGPSIGWEFREPHVQGLPDGQIFW